jgi:hypothetical protein
MLASSGAFEIDAFETGAGATATSLTAACPASVPEVIGGDRRQNRLPVKKP